VHHLGDELAGGLVCHAPQCRGRGLMAPSLAGVILPSCLTERRASSRPWSRPC
jgi:hypothetical protein